MQIKSKIALLSFVLFFASCNKHSRQTIDTKDPTQIKQKPTTDPKDNLTINQIKAEPYYKYAWHLAYNSFYDDYNIDPESNIHAQGAWKITTGEGVKVAVIDASNFDWQHEEIKENVIVTYNSDENNNKISNQGDSDSPSHGSTVAGFIASAVNGKGLVGVAPNAELILIKQVDSSDKATIKAFEFAKDQGAKIINCSWGTNNVSEAVSSALEDLKDDGVTIIFASGNEGESMDSYDINDESELASVIGVGSSDEHNDIASYSNFGKNIDLLAPGGDTDHNMGILGVDDSGSFGNYYQKGLVNDNYSFVNGTSFSAPIVTGVVALMVSVNPNLTPDEIRYILIQTADKIGDNANYKNGFDRYRAYGKINAQKAVEMARDYK